MEKLKETKKISNERLNICYDPLFRDMFQNTTIDIFDEFYAKIME
jgi:hypothetical protein